AAHHGDVHPDERQRAGLRLLRHDGPGYARQPHATQLFQPGGGRQGWHSGARRYLERRPLHAGRFHIDPDGRAQECGEHAIRLSQTHAHRRAHRPRRRAAPLRARVRPQLRAQQERRRARADVRGARVRAGDWPGDGDLHDGAGAAVLLGQLPGRHTAREEGGRLPAPLRLRDGDPTFSRLAEQARLPLDDPASGGAVPLTHHLQVCRPALRSLYGVVVLGALAAPVAAQLEPRELVALERERVVSAARRYLGEAPMTITAFPAPRSAGGPHDFYSEGDYWWPDPRSPDSP